MKRIIATLLAVFALVGCNSTVVKNELVVFAAASLTDTFTELGKEFERTHPGATVTFNFGASSTLAQNIIQGAPADVFAAANESTMKTLTDAGEANGSPEIFVRNQLQIVVPRGNPAKVAGLADFGRSDLRIAVCADQVPCGAAAKKVFQLAKIEAKPDTEERDVRAALTKVELGEVDAALVYQTDVKSAGESVEGIDFPESAEVVNNYPIVAITGSTGASAFIEFIRSDNASAVFVKAGFAVP